MFRVVSEPYSKNKFLWVAILTYPGHSRHILREDDDTIKTFVLQDLALLGGYLAFPKVLSDYYMKGSAPSSRNSQAKLQAERLFVASQRGVK